MDSEGVLKPPPRPQQHCVSWSEGSTLAEATPPPLVDPAPSLAEEFSRPAVIGHLGVPWGGVSTPSLSVRGMLLSVVGSSGGGGETRYEPLFQRSPPAHCTPTPRARASSDSGGGGLPASRSTDSEDDGYGEPDSSASSLLEPEAKQGYFLPRSSPVISRRKCPSNRKYPSNRQWPSRRQCISRRQCLSRSLSPSPSTAPPPSLTSPQPDELTETPPPGPQPCVPLSPGKPRCVSLSANLNRFMEAGFQFSLHFPRGREEGLKPRSQSEAHATAGPWKNRDSDETQTPDEILKASCDLDKENTHFIVVDMVLEAVETAKWTGLSQKGGGASEMCPDCIQETLINTSFSPAPRTKQHSASVASSDSGYVGWCNPVSSPSPSPSLTEEPTPVSDGDNPESVRDAISDPLHSSSQSPTLHCSAEVLALQLVSEFRKGWMTREELSPSSLGPALQEFLPDNDSMTTEDVLSLVEEIRQKSRMRGTLTWAPPRFQIIFNTHPTLKRSVVVASQHYLCAGCGTQVEAKYIKRLRYCEYLGKYFCDCCHSDGESVIPGHVLERWDFGRYAVCEFSRRLLQCVWHQPLFGLACIGKQLSAPPRELARFTDLQKQLCAIKKLLTACRLSAGVLQEFEQLPGNLTQEPLVFSMDDLQRIKRGQLVPQARALLRLAVAHVDNCQICLARGFICEFCKRKDVLFPFQTETCQRCRDCKACFHIQCFRDEQCPKCVRIQTRKCLTDTELSSLLTEQS